MNAGDAGALGIRHGWQVKVQSRHGEAVVPVRLREDLIPGIMLVPFGFRDHLSPVMEGRDAVAVRVERT